MGSVMLLFGVAGCATTHENKVDSRYEETAKAATGKAAKILPAETAYITKVQDAWLGSSLVAIKDRVDLPAAFRRPFTLSFEQKVRLPDIAEKLSQVTNIPVRIRPDVFMNANSLVPGGQAMMASAAAGAPPGSAVPLSVYGGASAPTSAAAQQSYAQEMKLNYSGTLPGLLDMVATRFGISWEYANDRIEFYRLVTKTFEVKANPGSSKFTSGIAKSGGQSGSGGGSSGSFSSTTDVSMESSFSVWTSMEAAIKAMLSQAGKVAISQATGSVTVTDASEIVERVSKYIDHENKLLTRQVALRVEVISVSLDDGAEAGLDWNLVYQRLSDAGTPKWAFTLGGAAPLTSALAGSLGVQVLTPANTGGQNWRLGDGTQALFKALNTVGKASILSTASSTTLNRQPVPIAITKQVSYLARTTPAAAGAGATGGTGVPGLEPGQVTTGFLLNVLPTVLDGDSVLLQFSLDVSNLDRIQTIGTGSGATLQQIQTPEVSGTQTLNRVSLRNGQTLVLSGFERTTDQYDKRGLTKDTAGGLFGTYSGHAKREAVVITVTPVITNGV